MSKANRLRIGRRSGASGVAGIALAAALLVADSATGQPAGPPFPIGPGAQPGVSPAAACSGFLPGDRPECEARTAEHLARAAELERRLGLAGPDHRCQLQCDLFQEIWRLRDATKGWSIRAIRALSGGARARHEAELAELDARRSGLAAERAALAAELAELRKGRVVQLYENIETGAIVEHAGRLFEPRAYLRHVGERRVPQMAGGRRRIAEGEARLTEIDGELGDLDAERSRIAPPGAPPDATEAMIQSMWGNHCNPAEAQAWLADCRRCGRGPRTAQFCPL